MHGSRTDRARARTNRTLQSKSATAEDTTHVHTHAHLSRASHPGTRARPPTIDGDTHAQRRAKLALANLSPVTELLAVLGVQQLQQ
eukprot:7135448-Prymnesium_polylepis.1